jgi:hypothetical protein
VEWRLKILKMAWELRGKKIAILAEDSLERALHDTGAPNSLPSLEIAIANF